MKNLLVFICSVMLLICLFIPVYANTDYLIDNAGLLSDAEEAELEAKLSEASDRLNADIVILTEEYISTDAESYADDYFDYNGYGLDGLILLVDMGGRNWYISTCGVCVDGFEGDGFDYVSENIVDDLQEENYSKCFNTFADRSDEVISLIREGKSFKAPFEFFTTLLICLVIGFVIALIVSLIMKAKLKSVHSKSEAADYLRNGSLNITVARDIFLYRQVTRTQKAESSSSSHTSSSGRSHGGGGGKF